MACYHFHLLMVLYPQHLNLIAIRGYFAHIPHDITLINEEDLWRLGPVNLVIAEWPCLGHSCVGATQGFEIPMSSIFETSSGLCSDGLPINFFLKGTFSIMYFCWETFKIRCIMFVNTLGIPFYGCRGTWFVFPPSLVALDQSSTSIHFNCIIFFAVPPYFDQNVDDILDPNWTSLPVVWNYLRLLALVNKMGHHGGYSQPLWLHHVDIVWWGMLTLKSIVNLLPMNGSVPWDFGLES